MKKNLLTISSLLIGASMMAQLPVSTTAGKKVAILEEFTGINCQFCPDGHRISEDIQTANPGKMFAINIHSGGYASPGNGQPDFRTDDGEAIDDAAAPAGYPAGGVNRGSGTGWADGRNTWTSKVNTIIGQNSPVNIALEGTLDSASRELIVNVEIYYTGSAGMSNQYLSVALLQSNVAGPQVDGGNFNPTGWQDQAAGIYNHIHMFRKFVNPTSKGEPIATTQGVVVSKQFIDTLPADIRSVDMALETLELVAYLTEGQNYTSPIVTGGHGDIKLKMASGRVFADLSAAYEHTKPANVCDKSFTPKMVVKNEIFSDTVVDKFEIGYTIGSTTFRDTITSQTLSPGDDYSHSFSSVTLNEGDNEVTYFTSVVDSMLVDNVTLNDESAKDVISVVGATAFSTNHSESFESSSDGDDAPANAVSMNPNKVSAEVTADAGKSSSKSFRWEYFNIAAGSSSSIVWEKLDFSNFEHPAISYDWAYRQYGAENDELKISVSTDCGANWLLVDSYKGNDLETTASSQTYFVPTSSHWKNNKVDLSVVAGESEVLVRMEGVSDYGNNLYVDNVNIDENLSWGIEELNQASFEVYPNPTNGDINVTFDLTESNNVAINVYNALGVLVKTSNLGNRAAGNVQQNIDLSGLNSGIYFVNVVIGENTISKKVTLK